MRLNQQGFYYVGSLTFIRKTTSERKSFDSSPEFTIPKLHGFVAGSIQLKELERNDRVITFDVHAKSTPDGKHFSVGMLYQKTRQAIREELGHY